MNWLNKLGLISLIWIGQVLFGGMEMRNGFEYIVVGLILCGAILYFPEFNEYKEEQKGKRGGKINE